MSDRLNDGIAGCGKENSTPKASSRHQPPRPGITADAALKLLTRARAEKTALRKSVSFQLGRALVNACKSWRGVLALPAALGRIRRRLRDRESRRRPPAPRVGGVPKLDASTAGRSLRVAAVTDAFTHAALSPECDMVQLHPRRWERQLREFRPDLVFFESAWKGLNGLWETLIEDASEEALGIIRHCRAAAVPSLFWNKEDPRHYDDFMDMAREVDYVFTTDADCVDWYAWELGHDRVFPLPFAAQPAIHNPTEKHRRKNAFCFAGSYYPAYPERCADFENLASAASALLPVVIYDRNFREKTPAHAFPEKFKPLVAGTLDYADIDAAYKGYRWGINLNTVKDSRTMCSRRVFELMASNTPVLSNYSLAMREIFGDLAIASDSREELGKRAGELQDELTYRKFRLLGLRKVMAEHTYRHRLAFIRNVLGAPGGEPAPPPVCLVARAESPDERRIAAASFARQRYADKRLILLGKGTAGCQPHAPRSQDMQEVERPADAVDAVMAMAGDALVGLFSCRDYYGGQYLTDIVQAFMYAPADACGKSARYRARGNAALELENDGGQYRLCAALPARAALVRRSAVSAGEVEAWLREPDTARVSAASQYGVDEFNYVMDGSRLEDAILDAIEDLPIPN